MTARAPAVVNIPVVATPRLRLRAHGPDDFEPALALWTDPRVYRYISGKASTPEEVWARLLRYSGHWAWMKYGFWAIEETDTGAFVGEVGYGEQMREIEPSLVGMPEMGWVLLPEFHGRGYAFEAVQAAQRWGLENLATKRTCCIIAPDNVRSIQLAQKCGFREWQHTVYHQEPTIICVHDASAPE